MLKKIFSTIISVVLAVTLCVTTCTSAFAATSKQEYISDVVVCSASSADEAKKALAEAGYELMSNESLSASGMYMGYKTTTDKDEAITDISAMNMDGNYSFTDYEVLMEQMKEEVSNTVDGLIPMISAYRTNYKEKAAYALSVYEVLNRFYEDDSKTGMGDYLLSCDLKDTTELTKVFMQANSSFIVNIQQLLFLAGEGAGDQKWIEKMAKGDEDYLLDTYMSSYSTPNKAMKALIGDYGTSADAIRSSWNDFYQVLTAAKKKYFTDNNGKTELNKTVVEENLEEVNKTASETLADDATGEEILESTTDGMESNSILEEVQDVALIEYLETVKYGDGTMLDFFMRDESEVDNFELYTLAYYMGNNLCAQITNVGLHQVVSRVTVDGDEVNVSDLDKITQSLDGIEQVSIYEGVDRQLFEGGVALTSATTQKSTSSLKSWWDGLFDRAFSNDSQYKWYDLLALYVLPTVVSAMIWGGLHFINYYFFDYIPLSAGASGRALELIDDATRAGKSMEEALRIANNKYDYLMETYMPRGFKYAVYGKGTGAEFTGIMVFRAIKCICFVVMIALSIATIAKVFINLYTDDSRTYTDIPTRIVDTVSTDYGDDYVSYSAVQNLESKAGDIYNYKGKNGWLVLYYSKDKSIGEPITSSVKIVKGSTNAPLDYENVSMFNDETAINLTAKDFTGVSDSANGTYMYFARGTSTAVGSIFSNGNMAIALGVGAVIGIAIDMILQKAKNKKKKA